MTITGTLNRILSLITALSLMLSLAACGSNAVQTSTDDASASQTESMALNLTGSEKTNYGVSGVPLPFEADIVSAFVGDSDGETLYVCYAIEENEEYTYYAASMGINAENFTIIQQASIIEDIAVGSGALWTLSSDQGDETLKVNSFTTDGTPIGLFIMPEEIDLSLDPGALNVDSEGYIYYTAYNGTQTTIYVMEQDGTFMFELTKAGLPANVVTTSEGTVGLFAYNSSEAISGNASYQLSLIDVKNESWGEVVALDSPQDLYSALSSSFMLNDTTSVYAYDADTGESEAIFTWLDINLVSTSNLVVEMANGNFAVMCNNFNYTTLTHSYEYCIVGPADESQMGEKQTITLAGIIQSSSLASAVAEFNINSDKYIIEYTTYLSYADASDTASVQDAINRFNTDILAGNVPSIIDLCYMSPDLYASKGLLDDLYAYIDADPDLDRSDFFESILKAFSIDGELSYIVDGVYLYTMFGTVDTFGTEAGISAVEFNDILNAYIKVEAPLGVHTTKMSFLMNMLCGNVDYIDWTTGKCNFVSSEFIGILEIANRMPLESGEYDFSDISSLLESSKLVADGSQLAAIETLMSPDQVAAYNQRLGDRLNIVGLPTDQGVCHVVDAQTKLAISSRSQNKEAAWEFIRMLLDDDTQLSNALLPISRSAFNKLAKSALDGNSLYAAYYPDMEITEDDITILEDLLESVNYSMSYDQVIMAIIGEEAEAYFAGKVTADVAAEYIQNRVQTYVNEQM